MTKAKIAGAISALLVLLFTYTAASKFLDMHAFRGSMNIQPVPPWMPPILTWLIPSTETLSVICLLFDRSRRTGLKISLVLSSVFTLYAAAILLDLFHKIPCSCGGIVERLSWPQHLWLNLILSLLTVYSLYVTTRKPFPSLINQQV